MSENTDMKRQRGSLKVELVLGVLGAIGVPVAGGMWIGSIQKQTNLLEGRIEKTEQLPVNVAVLQTDVATVREDVRDMKAEVRGMRHDLQELTNELRH